MLMPKKYGRGLLGRLLDASERYPTHVAISDYSNNRQWTYREFQEAVEHYQSVLLQFGLGRSDEVLLLIDQNAPEFVFVFYAIAAVGGIAVLMPDHITQAEWQQQCELCSIKAVFMSSKSYSRVESSWPKTLDAEQVFVLNTLNDVTALEMAPSDGHRYELIDVEDLEFDGYEPLIDRIDDSVLQLPFTVHFTYRGEGIPLKVVHRYDDYSLSIDGHRKHFSRPVGSRHASILPMTHVFGLVSSILLPLCDYGEVVMGLALNDQLLQDLKKADIRLMACVPAVLRLLILQGKRHRIRLSKDVVFVVGGSQTPKRWLEEAEDTLGVGLCQGYGTTETLPVSATVLGDSKSQSLGRCFIRGATFSVRDSEGTEVPLGCVGELCIDSPTSCGVYQNSAPLNNEYFDQGYFRSGDLVWMDDAGYCHFVDRRHAISKISGYMVDLVEVKAAVERHPSVQQASVFTRRGKHDELLHVAVKVRPQGDQRQQLPALIREVPDEDKPLNRDTLRSFLKASLSSHKIPRVMTFYGSTHV